MKYFVLILALSAAVMCQVEFTAIKKLEQHVGASGYYENPYSNVPSPSCNQREEFAHIFYTQDGIGCFPMTPDGSCPGEYPAGNTAVPMAVLQDQQGQKLCALVCKGPATGSCAPDAICTPFNGDLSVCLYPVQAALGVLKQSLAEVTAIKAPVKKLEQHVGASTHYENPYSNVPSPSCGDDEELAHIQGQDGVACFPKTDDGNCPQDYPAGNTSMPQAILQDQEGNTLCGLVCAGPYTGSCAPGSICMAVNGSLSVCLYPLQAALGVLKQSLAELTVIKAPVKKLEQHVGASTHYENPYSNVPSPSCGGDEVLANIQGQDGIACFPLTNDGTCPQDAPAGSTAMPQDVLENAQGQHACGLVCKGPATGSCAPGAICMAVSSDLSVCLYPVQAALRRLLK